MRREEAGLVAVGILIGSVLIAAAAYWQHWLAASQLANAASNLLGLLAGPSIVAAVSVSAWNRWHDRCSTPRCIRRGKHPVDGCVASVCDHHHTEDAHRAAYEASRADGILGWGESHRR